jgi:Domain of unknown function (DUF4381)
MRSSRELALCVAVLAAVHGSTGVARGQETIDDLRARATVEPVNVRLGEPARYRAVVLLPPGTSHARWVPPKNDEEWTWGPLSPQRIRSVSSGALDTLVVETTVQSFRTGTQMVPGLRFEAGAPGAVRTHRVPEAALSVIPMLSAADSNADLRPPRGPAAAPWWETVPWHWVLLAVVVLAAAYALFRWWRSRARRVQPGVAPSVDPAVAALAELAALRGLHLPAHGRFAEHAFQLTRIIRRYLEVMVHAPRPGHTSSELMAALERTRLSDDDRRMLSALLRVWDRIKFARATSTAEESRRSEEMVEQLIRQLSRPAVTPADAGGKAA